MKKDEIVQQLNEVLKQTENVEVCRIIGQTLTFLDK